MIYDFTQINNAFFDMNGIKYKRTFRLVEQSDKSVKVYDIKTGHTLGFYKIDEVSVNSQIITNWTPLKELLYNFMCDCGGEDNEPVELSGIFDDTFDDTFE